MDCAWSAAVPRTDRWSHEEHLRDQAVAHVLVLGFRVLKFLGFVVDIVSLVRISFEL